MQSCHLRLSSGSLHSSSLFQAPRETRKGEGEGTKTTGVEQASIAVVSVSFKPNGASTRGHWAKRSKKVGAGGGAGKERECLPLSPDILLNAVHQRTGGNDVLPLA